MSIIARGIAMQHLYTGMSTTRLRIIRFILHTNSHQTTSSTRNAGSSIALFSI